MGAGKKRQVCDVQYFKNKKHQHIKATTVFVEGRRCVQFEKFKQKGRLNVF